MQNEEKGQDFQPSTIETIDTAVHRYIEGLNLHVQTNKGLNKVPIIWVGAERTYQLKHDLTLRDSEGLLKLPLMTVERKELTKTPEKSPLPGVVRDNGDGGWIPVRKRINQERTSAFKSAHKTKKSGAEADVGFQTSQYPVPRKFPTKIAPMFDTRPVNVKDKTVYQTTYIPVPVYVESL